MKKLVMMLAVLALLMAFPAAAGAKKPPAPPGQEPFPGLTCADRTFDDPALWYVGTATATSCCLWNVDSPCGVHRCDFAGGSVELRDRSRRGGVVQHADQGQRSGRHVLA